MPGYASDPSQCGPDERYDPDRYECVSGPGNVGQPSTGGYDSCPGESHFDPGVWKCVPNAPAPSTGGLNCTGETHPVYSAQYPNGACLPNTRGGGAGEGEGGGLPEFMGSSSLKYGPVPTFTAPKFAYGAWTPPDPKTLLDDPGYKFRLDEGQRALENSAGAKGVLRTGQSLKDILGWGQGFASQEFGSAFDRSLSAYTTNYGVARDVFDRLYTGAKDEFAPKLLGWQSTNDQTRLNWQRDWDDYWKRIDDEYRRSSDVLRYGAGG